MSQEVETDPVLPRAVADPPKLLFVSASLFKAEMAALMVAYLLLMEPLVLFVGFAVLHPACALLTRKDPYIVEVYQARFRCRKTRNLRPVPVNRYVP